MVELARTALGRAPAAGETWSERDVVLRALAAMEDSRQSWTRSNLMMAVSAALPANPGVAAGRVQALLEGLTDRAEALARHLNPREGPQGLDAQYYRADGESVFVKPHSQRYATPDPAGLGGGAARGRRPPRRPDVGGRRCGGDDRPVRPRRVGVERRPGGGAAGHPHLRRGGRGPQRPGRYREVVPGRRAGRHLAADRPPRRRPGARRPDPHAGEGPRVFGVAYGQRQADVLAEEGVTARNIRAWLDGQARLEHGRGKGDDETFRLRRGDLLVVDEAAAASTPDLVAIHRRCEAAGVKLLLVGDQKQLAAVGAGGALADIAERGIEYQLAEVRRFTERGKARRRCGCATATPPWSASTPSTAGSSTPAPSSRPNRPPAARGWPTPSTGATL